MRWFLTSALLLLALSANTVAASKVGDMARDQQLQDIIYWVRSEGGFFNDKLEIRRADPADPTSYYGIFAKETIQLNERIMTIESSSMMRHELGAWASDDEKGPFQVLCSVTHMLLKELRLGVKSKYAPYINYLLEEEHGQIPATWSQAGKDMLVDVIDEGTEGWNGWNMTEWIKNSFEGKCIKEGDPFEIQALALAAQRGYHNLLIPLYDMVNHSNDKEAINVENTSIDLDGMRVAASREIPAGQELLTTYKSFTDGDTVPNDWGTQEILCNYGFVEPYPRKFKLGLDHLRFSVRENKQTEKLEVTWLLGVNEKIDEEIDIPDAEDIDWMKQYRRILEGLLHGGTLEARRNVIPKREWNVIFEYLQAILTAVDSAIETLLHDLEKYDLDPANYEGECDKDGNCSAPPWLSYANLDEPIAVDEEKEYMFIYQSETLVYGIDHYSPTGRAVSHYQTMDYYMEPRTKEMCFNIDTVFQMCSSYRPHYHEMGVHLPARYLPEGLKRVLWIGGGDAMFLHEFLKYPDLELAVGLELDQKVTRGAFQYFGVQPHFDNEKVQWWFGDASKSLLMLPKDYFGSFDMVMVDLSDTVLSLSVTKEMDIIGALSLLLKPDGIFVMNEMVR
jgi:hypothetical protein